MVYKLRGIEDGLNVLVDTEDEWGAQVPQSQQAENASTKGDVETESKKEKGKGCVHGSLQATDMSVNVLCLSVFQFEQCLLTVSVQQQWTCVFICP